MKRVLGLDLGTTSIGWALVNQAETEYEKSSIINAGVRINPISTDEKDSFERGKDITTNSSRRLIRSLRRNKQRYYLRRNNLIDILLRNKWIDSESILTESGNCTTFETYKFRALAVHEEIPLLQLARVLLMINKKRGYKSNRKLNGGDEGHLFDSIDVTRILLERGITPGEYCFELISKGKNKMPEFYGSDLKNEFNRIWDFQATFYPEYLNEEFKNQVTSNFGKALNKVFYAKYSITTADNKGKDKKLNEYKWRSEALTKQLPIETVALVLSSVSNAIASSSGYLGDISDRSKMLYFNNMTVGEYLYEKIQNDSNFSVKNKVFYRQDYIDEFNKIWDKQAEFHKELNEDLKSEIRDRIIFYQRRLKSQKNLISLCEFEHRTIEIESNGVKKTKEVGCRVAPVSSPVFQDFRMWQKINNLRISRQRDGETIVLKQNDKQYLAEILKYEHKLSSSEIIKILLQDKSQGYDVNFENLEGNQTIAAFFDKFVEICSATGHDVVKKQNLGIFGYKESISEIFNFLGFNTEILEFDSLLDKKNFEEQPLFKLWHLIYSYEGDNSKTGDESLIRKIGEICQMPEEYARIIAGISFQQDYGSLSNKAMRNILPFMIEGYEYSEACGKAGYRHSAKSLTKEEKEGRALKDSLEPLKMNALRNPVVEKIICQMINVVNAVSDKYGKPDEINIELARELKSSKDERKAATDDISKNQKRNEEITKILKAAPFNLTYVSKNDIVRYRLFDELKSSGYKTLYSNQYIPIEKLFSKEIDIEHIIPQSVLFNDSFSNKTLEYRSINLEKDKQTAYDYVSNKYGQEGLTQYLLRVNDAYRAGSISKAKRDNLLRDSEHIPTDFINRDLKETQYITKKAKEILEDLVRDVVVTTGSITSKLREDWGLVDVLKELDCQKLSKLGMTYTVNDNNGREILKFSDWSKRNDNRHHAMDAITIAFTKPAHIQYLNNLNAKGDKSSSIYAIKQKETELSGTKRIFKAPIERNELRAEVKRHLENILVSNKAKNKVMTRNTNIISRGPNKYKQECLTPRGALHKEFVYGLRRMYETRYIKPDAKMTEDVISSVASKEERFALTKRLEANGMDPKKAFTGKNTLEKNPIWLDAEHTRQIPNKVKCVRLKEYFTIRKAIAPDLNVEKVVDTKVRSILQERLKRFGNDAAKAFSNLDADPIWLNEEKKQQIKRVCIAENFALSGIRIKRDNSGKTILDSNGMIVPSDYINFRNNHHCAIFEDEEGNLQEHIVTFYDAVKRKNEGLPIVDRTFNSHLGWKFLFTLKIGEMFVFTNEETGFDPNEIDLKDPKNYSAISPNLFRVQKLSSNYYCFRHHLDTTTEYGNSLRGVTWERITNINNLRNIVKIRINHIGEIVSVGEYD